MTIQVNREWTRIKAKWRQASREREKAAGWLESDSCPALKTPFGSRPFASIRGNPLDFNPTQQCARARLDRSRDLGCDAGSLIQLFQSCGRPIIAIPRVGLGGQPWAE